MKLMPTFSRRKTGALILYIFQSCKYWCHSFCLKSFSYIEKFQAFQQYIFKKGLLNTYFDYMTLSLLFSEYFSSWVSSVRVRNPHPPLPHKSLKIITYNEKYWSTGRQKCSKGQDLGADVPVIYSLNSLFVNEHYQNIKIK